jgi:Ca2+-binding RTX toxin-like protein
VIGAGGADYIAGGLGRDAIRAGAGADVIFGGPGGEVADGGGGPDKIYGGQQDDVLLGSRGDDLLIGDQGLDRIKGGTGNDWLRGDTGTSLYDGGAGSDWLSFAAATTGGGADLAEGQGAAGTFASGAVTGVENILGTGYADYLRGGVPWAATVRGLGSRPNPLGGNPTDVCEGFAVIECGQDPTGGALPAILADQSATDAGVRVYGGAASESFRVSAISGGVRVQASARLAAGPGCSGAGTTIVTCTIAGQLGYLVVQGGPGDDSIVVTGDFGPQATVNLDGGPGNDQVHGGPGEEILSAGDDAYVPGDPLDPDHRPFGTSADLLDGGGGDDTLNTGFAGPDTLLGGAGSDQLVARHGCEGNLLDGGPGGSDIAGFAPAPSIRARLGGEAVELGPVAPGLRYPGGCRPTKVSASNEILEGSSEEDVLTGNRRGQLILGRGGNDLIRGMGGGDTLRGQPGADTLLGGGGPDTLEAKDGERDRRLDCGAGGRTAERDPRDPPARHCHR